MASRGARRVPPFSEGQPSAATSHTMPTASTRMHEGYCDTTGFGSAGDCTTDDKGSFEAHIKHEDLSTWEKASQTCERLCLSCARCSYVSVSVQWSDCSWFNTCDLHRLKKDVPGHRSFRVREASSVATVEGNSRDLGAQNQALWQRLRTLPAVEPGECWSKHCRAGGGGGRHSHSNTSADAADEGVSFAAVGESWAAAAEGRGRYFHIWRSFFQLFRCVVLARLQPGQGPPPMRTVHIPALSADG